MRARSDGPPRWVQALRFALLSVLSGGGAAQAEPASPTYVAANSALAETPSTRALAERLGFAAAGDAPPVTYASSASPCSLNSGTGDGGSEVTTSDGGCWLAKFAGPIDAADFGKSYPLGLFGASTGDDHGGANYCLTKSDPCTAQGAITKAYQFNAKSAALTIHLAAGNYDVSLFAAGPVPGFGTSNAGYTDGAFIQLSGAGSGSTVVRPTTGGGGCAQNYGDGLTLTAHAAFELDHLTIGSSCSGRSGVFLQNWAQLAPGPDVQWASASGPMIHVEANANLEFAAASPFIIAAGATASAAIAYSTGGVVNFDGGQIVFNGNATFSTAFIAGNEVGVSTFLAGTTVNLNSHTVTGPQYSLGGMAMLYNQAALTIPGSKPGVLTPGGFYLDNIRARFGAIGKPSGSGSGPTVATTNLLLYANSSTDYAGWMATMAGDICGVTGIAAPACRFNIMSSGGLTAPWSVGGGDEGAGTLNISGPYYESGAQGVTCSGAPSASFASTGGIVTHC